MCRVMWAIVLLVPFAVGTREPLTARDKAPAFLTADLSGWEGLMEYWTYKDGVLTGAAPKGLKFNTFLCSKKKYADFELHFQVKLTGSDPNSGVQIRSKLIPDTKVFAVMGPQCDMGQVYWGSLYGEHIGGMMKPAPKDVVAKVLKKNDFNDYYIKCVGTHVTIKLNGEVTVDGDFPKMSADGIIAFQIHSGGPMEAIFKDIKFTEFPRGKEPKKGASAREAKKPAADKAGKLSEHEAKMVKLINEFRATEKKTPLAISAVLCEVSRKHAHDMAKEGKLEHKLYGKGPDDRAKAAGYKGAIAENVAGGGFPNTDFYFKLWEKSEIHRMNMLGDWKEMGIGFATAADGKKQFYTAMFSRGK
jgi:uncharacterized protein YkwD